MTIDLNVKTVTIDSDQASLIAGVQNPVNVPINFYRGNTYVIQANCYSNSFSNTFSSFSTDDVFALYIGSQYESNANPIIAITNPVNFNNTTSDWSMANVSAGMISCRVNVNGSALTADIGNNSSKAYDMDIVLTNNASAKVMVCNSVCVISNAVQE